MKNNVLDNLRNLHGEIHELNVIWKKDISVKVRKKEMLLNEKN